MDDRNVLRSLNQINPENDRIAEIHRLLEQLGSRISHGFDLPTDGSEMTELRDLSPQDPQTVGPHHDHSISISWPATPTGLLVRENAVRSYAVAQPDVKRDSVLPKFQSYSQPLPAARAGLRAKPRLGKDTRFDSFKTWSGQADNQISDLPSLHPSLEPSGDGVERATPPVQRYFDALEGPELDILRPTEAAVLPEDKPWPFLLRFPISSFGICMGMGSQAILWKTLAASPATKFLRISSLVNILLWCTSLLLMIAISVTYALKAVFYLEAVRREFYHPVRMNFFFAPWIAVLFLFLGLPEVVHVDFHGGAAWYCLMAPILFLELKIYGQWMSGGQRRLSRVANPSNHLAIVGNFVGALLGASLGLKEGPIFFFAVGLAHYAVLFVTLYQRLPTNETLPKELHPVFFLFVAAPSVASLAWARISGTFDYVSRIAYFIALFLYASLAVRVNFFRGFRFSMAWWAYTFPTTGAAIATIRYAAEVENPFTQSLSLLLSAVSAALVALVMVSTAIHAVVLRDLFPNDISIAIASAPPRQGKTFPDLSLPSFTTTQEKDEAITTLLNGR
ncbi:S-type anion channel SLAH2-like [Wolffia australiana]